MRLLNSYYVSLGIQLFDLFAIDIMHNFEIGAFKRMFVHLIRIAYSIGPEAVQELNQRQAAPDPWQHLALTRTCRFWLIPTFGQDTIQRFSGDVSNMKKMSARHFEDILQVSCVANFYLSSLNPAITGGKGAWNQ